MPAAAAGGHGGGAAADRRGQRAGLGAALPRPLPGAFQGARQALPSSGGTGLRVCGPSACPAQAIGLLCQGPPAAPPHPMPRLLHSLVSACCPALPCSALTWPGLPWACPCAGAGSPPRHGAHALDGSRVWGRQPLPHNQTHTGGGGRAGRWVGGPLCACTALMLSLSAPMLLY
jgi:hypothetical protein